jgi:hypothetical protein
MEESVLTEFVRRDLESIGYTTYAEVCIKGGGDIRCDMFALMEDRDSPMFGQSIVFEAKLTFNFKVLEQAWAWKSKKRSHEVYVIVPTTFKNTKTRKFAREICKSLGIGVMEVNVNTQKYQITVKPAWCKNPKLPALYEEQKFIIASNSENKFMTPFKVTVKRLNEYMRDRDRELLTVLVKNVKHHYKGDIAAVRAIKFLVEKNVIQGFYISKEKNKIVIRKYAF